MSLEAPGSAGARARAAAAAAAGSGRAIYELRCQSCHGVNREGNGAAPSLDGVVQRLGADTVQQVIEGGRGEMPSFQGIDTADLNALAAYLSDPDATGGPRPNRPLRQPARSWTVPVAGSGGVPIGKRLEGRMPAAPSAYSAMEGPAYPDGTEGPKQRYYTNYNIMRHITSPPWSTLTAFDLNKGTIKWQVPLGEDVRAVAEGARNTGTMLEPKGILVTPTGLVFHAARDGKIRAYDAENGNELWSADLPAGSAAIPAMYEVNGRAYLVVSATAPTPQLGVGETGVPQGNAAPAANSSGPLKAYVTFALGEKGK